MSAASRSVTHVDVKRLVELDDLGLRDLMNRLLHAEAALCGVERSQVRVNAETKARDRGCDAFTPDHAGKSDWLKNEATCWQFKAGTAGQPGRLDGEITSSNIPGQTLREGGWFIVVASACVNGESGRLDRLDSLKAQARAAQLPTDKIDVYTADTLEGWCNARRPLHGR